MFKKLIEQIFPSLSDEAEANVFYFEETRQAEHQLSEPETENAPSHEQNTLSTEQQHQLAFYDSLFGQSGNLLQQDELSQYVADKIGELLAHPGALLKSLPMIPASLSQVMETINDNDFDVNKLIEIIEHEPLIAAKVIELANSSFYKRGEKEVTDLKSAFMGLGKDGFIEGVINGFVSSLTPQSKLYFSQYGNKIWQHSFSTGLLSKTLLHNAGHKALAPQGYLIGLLCNLGDVIIYQLMVDAFSVVHPDCHPDSWAFKKLMVGHSKMLTCQMARFWQFPDSIIKTLLAQAKLTDVRMLKNSFEKYPLACFVYEANLLSELELRLSDQQLDSETLLQAGQALIYSEQAREYLEELAGQ